MTDETQKLTREQELMEEFRAGLDQDGPVVLAQRVAGLEGEVASLRNDLVAANARADAAEKKAKAKVSAGDKQQRARVLKPDAESLRGDELKAAIASADKVEIVFSDGKKEITDIPPQVVEGDVWKDHTQGLMLRDPVTVQGPQPGTPGYTIAGYALLLDGKQVAYAQRPDPIVVVPGRAYQLSDDIIF